MQSRGMPLRGEVAFSLQHGDDLVYTMSHWSVPYAAWLHRGQVEEVESDGLPHLTGLTLHIGPLSRALELPDAAELRQWSDVWCQDSADYQSELLDRFQTDCQTRYWAAREQFAA